MATGTIKLAKVIQTCVACPSQWDAWDTYGNYYYLRYRYGHGKIERQPSPDVNEWGPRNPIDSFNHGDALDGIISLEDFLTHCPTFELADDCEYKEYDWSIYDAPDGRF